VGERNSAVALVDVSALFRLPAGIAISDLVEAWPVGYRLMCRFQIYHIWQFCRQYDYIMRVDEDCAIRSAGINPIEWTARQGADLAACTFVGETHELTSRTLPAFVDEYLGIVHPDRRSPKIYNHWFPYTNL
jgi:hypothetical protein